MSELVFSGPLREIVPVIDQKRSILLSSVNDLSQSQLDFRPEPDAWSVGQVLNHLLMIEGAITQLMNRKLRQAQPVDPSLDLTAESVLEGLDLSAVAATLPKVQAPAPFVPDSGTPKAELLAALSQSRSVFHSTLARACGFDLRPLRHPHFMFGELNLYQWTVFIGLHESRHTQQIDQVKLAAGFPASGIGNAVAQTPA